MQWIEDLHDHVNCSPYFQELLVLINNGMLHEDPGERAGSDFVAEQLQAMANCCQSDQVYAGNYKMGQRKVFDDDVFKPLPHHK